MVEKYRMKESNYGQCIDDSGNVIFYKEKQDIDIFNEVNIDVESMTVESNMRTVVKFDSKEDFELFLKYHKNVFKVNGFKEDKESA